MSWSTSECEGEEGYIYGLVGEMGAWCGLNLECGKESNVVDAKPVDLPMDKPKIS